MSSNGINTTEDSDMVECDGEKVVTMMDVLQEQQDFEEDANAVLGASDDKNCTFVKGYIKRQALYACLTCCSDARTDPTKRAGVCLACSLNCHENHELIELYTKRNFRCDCGNPKFNSHPCQYTPDKQDLNEENSYNQNFSGLYCTCHRPYPDPESTFEDEMIQCIICEDWLHSSHLEATLPPNDQYAEMVCKACMENNEFLHDYSEFAVNNETAEVDVSSVGIIAADKSADSDTLVKVNGVLDSANVHDVKDTKNDVEMAEVENCNKNDKESSTEPKEDLGEKIEVKKESGASDTKDETKTDIPIPDTTNISKENLESETPSEKENDKQDQTTENNDLKIDNIPNDPASECTAKDGIDDKKDVSLQEENKMETTSTEAVVNNDNSIIESIEKLENELGNVERKDAIEEEEQTPSENNDKTESKDDNSITTSAGSENIESDPQVNKSTAENKPESEELKPNDVVMNGENDIKVDTENNTSNDAAAETTEEVQNGVVENDVFITANDTSHELEAQADPVKDSKRKLSTEESDEVSTKKPKLEKPSCCSRPRGVKRIFNGATFWPSNFRQKLCTCNECITMYKDLSVLFLTDLEDTVSAYEALGKRKTDGAASSQYERGLEALSSLDRIQQINALTEYNKMRDKLLDFLKSFKDRKEVVKEEDIKAFFAGMKPKREPDGVYFCR